MVQPSVIRDGLHPPSIFSRGTFAEEGVCTFLGLDIPAQLCDMRIRLDDFLVRQLEFMVIVVSGSDGDRRDWRRVRDGRFDRHNGRRPSRWSGRSCDFLVSALRAFSGPAAHFDTKADPQVPLPLSSS